MINEALLKLHMTFVNLCADGIITEDEHGAFESVLDIVAERTGEQP